MPQGKLPNHIQNTLGDVKHPVRLVAFSTAAGCIQCPHMLDLARTIKTSSGKIKLETYDFTMDRDQAEQYGVHYVPALVVQGASGRAVNFYGLVDNIFLHVLVDTILASSTERARFTEEIRSALGRLKKDVMVRVFVENDSPACRTVADIAIGFALESELIHLEIVVARDFPDLVKKYNVSTLPKTVFGGSIHVNGEINETVFLEKIFEAEGVKPGGDRRCIICSNPSHETICASCKSRIQAEAVGIKLREEQAKRKGAEARRHEKARDE